MVIYSINNKAHSALASPQQIIDMLGTVRGALLYTYGSTAYYKWHVNRCDRYIITKTGAGTIGVRYIVTILQQSLVTVPVQVILYCFSTR